MAKPPSTLPPRKEGAKPRAKRPPPDDLPKCALPSKKRKAKASPPAAKPAAPAWDPAAEAAAAKSAVMAKTGRKATVPIDPPIDRAIREDLEPGPMGGKLKRRRKVVAADPDPAPPAPAAPRTAAHLIARIRRPSVPMTADLFETICLLVSEGIPLQQICRFDDMPSSAGFYQYLEDARDEEEHARRVARYARARALGFDALAAETLEIVDDGSNDYMERERDGDTEIVVDKENIARSKLRAEHRLKLLACWDPKRYGAQLKLADPNGDRLDRGGMSTNDLAIWISKIAVAVEAEGSGTVIEGTVIAGR